MKAIPRGIIGAVILATAVPLWLCLFGGPGFGSGISGFLTPAIVLAGITFALHRLLRTRRHAWSLAALLAPILAIVVLLLVAEASRRWS